MRFRDPEFLFILLLWIPMVWVYFRREKRTRPAVRFSDLSVAKKVSSRFSTGLRHSLIVFRLLGVGLLTVALARPQMGHTEQEVTTHGVDIMLVLDVSTSMRALDFKPKNRLFVAKERIKDFISKRVHDRIGLVVFAGRSYTKAPLTLDYDILGQFLDEVEFGEIEDGTAIGTALATAASRIKDSKAKSKIMILLTDGANNRGDISPQVAAEAAGELGIKIYTIGVGKKGKVPMPVDYIDRRTGKVVDTRVLTVDSDLDEESLKEIAGSTGGEFFRAGSPQQLADIYDKIDELEKTEIKTKSYTTWSERFFPWLLAGVAVLFLELVLAYTRFRRIP
ncbi:MAG: vWA domain-containing protein [Chitinivibrionales bacterium]